MSGVMEGSAKTGEITPHDQQPLEMAAAAKELAETKKNHLFDFAMKRDWKEVVKIYKGYPEVHSAKIIRSGDTALHIAVSYGEESFVEQLVELISRGGELKMVLKIISSEAHKVLKKTALPPEESPVKEFLKNISDKANRALEIISQSGDSAKEAVQIISDLEAISGRKFSDQLEDEAKKALEIISSKARQAKEIIYRAEAKKALEVITGEAKKTLEKLHEEDESVKKYPPLKSNFISDVKAKKSKEALALEAFQSISDRAMKALSEITDHEAKSNAMQKISELANKEALGTICGDTWKERLKKILAHLEEIYAEEAKKSLEIKNKRGNTALHLAAERGNARMCRCIAQIYWEGLGVKNNDQETPFFVAALNGRKDAFLCLHSLSPKYKDFPRIRGKDGETILHCAIHGNYLDLAFQIINLYPELANRMTVNGLSPLHVLASKPNAFSSGSHLGRVSKIIYFCTFVDELKEETSVDPSKWKTDQEKDSKYPENYQVCVDFFQPFRTPIHFFLERKKDTENKGSKEGEASKDGGGSKKLVQRMISKTVDFFMKAKNKFSLSICKDKKTEEQTGQPNGQTDLENPAEQRHEQYPAKYHTCFKTIKLVFKAMLIILGFGSSHIRKVRHQKQKHTWSAQVMNQLLDRSQFYRYQDDGQKPEGATPGFLSHEELERGHEDDGKETPTGETAILIAAKNGITEMVKRILKLFPVAIYDTNSNDKNIVLLAVENRQPDVYRLLMEEEKTKDVIFHKTDRDGNSALHLAAKLGDHRPWRIPGAALQMQWELKWFEFVKASVPLHFFPLHNRKGHTPKEIFTETHKELADNAGKWLTSTSESCSVVATLIAAVVFPTSSTVPGGVKENDGNPNFENRPAFDVFAISSLVALCFSVTSLVMFLGILTSRREEKDFRRNLPKKLLVGLTSLFVSITAMLISFCAGHFFILKDTLKFAAWPVYAVTCLPVTFFAIAQFPLYFDLTWATFENVPQRSYKSSIP